MAENFVRVPWSIEDSDLDPYQFRLWVHIARVGICWQSIRTLADACNMSVGKASQTRTWLLDNGYLELAVDEKSGKVGVIACSLHEQTQQNCSHNEQLQQPERSPHEQRSPDEQNRSPHEQNRSPHERHLKKNTEEEYMKEEEGERAPARDAAGEDAEILAFLEQNSIAQPDTDDDWQHIRHPAVWAWMETTRRFPGYDKLPAIIRRLGPEPDRGVLQLAWEDWVASGYRKRNVTGILDYYEERLQPARASPNGHHDVPEPAGFAAIRAVMEEFDE